MPLNKYRLSYAEKAELNNYGELNGDVFLLIKTK